MGNGKEPSKRRRRYCDSVAAGPPRQTLLDALARFPASSAPRFAVDLGCGQGRDTVELLGRGWHVLGVDAQEAAIARLRARPDLPTHGELETQVASFEAVRYVGADLVNASFALPFCERAAFPEAWARIVAGLKPGGRFCGQLFGPEDDWAERTVVQSRAEVEALLAPFVIERLDEEQVDGSTALGESKHWHIWHIVARKRDA